MGVSRNPTCLHLYFRAGKQKGYDIWIKPRAEQKATLYVSLMRQQGKSWRPIILNDTRRSRKSNKSIQSKQHVQNIEKDLWQNRKKIIFKHITIYQTWVLQWKKQMLKTQRCVQFNGFPCMRLGCLCKMKLYFIY